MGHNLPEIAYLAVVETGPDLRYDYPPMLEALVQLVSCVSTTRGFSGVSMILNCEGRLLALEHWRCKALHRGLEDIFLKMLMLQGELFKCSEDRTNECYWDKVREKFAQAKFYGASWREAVNAALSAGVYYRNGNGE